MNHRVMGLEGTSEGHPVYHIVLTDICMTSSTEDSTDSWSNLFQEFFNSLIIKLFPMSELSMVQLKAYAFTTYFPCILRINLSSFSLQQAFNCLKIITTLASPGEALMGNYSV